MSNEKQPKLLPIGSRVICTKSEVCVKGTILAYDGVDPMSFLENAPELISSSDDKVIDSYVIRWDVRWKMNDHDVAVHPEYPRGLKEVRKHDTVREYWDVCSIFPNNWLRIMARAWSDSNNAWSSWLMISEEQFAHRADENIKKDWDFVVRPLPKNPVPRYSPPDGSFIPLTRWKEGYERMELMTGKDSSDPKGYCPPVGIFVEFEVSMDFKSPKLFKGITSELHLIGMGDITKTVFVCGPPDDVRTWSISRVSKWRELANPKDFTPEMWEYISEGLRPKLSK